MPAFVSLLLWPGSVTPAVLGIRPGFIAAQLARAIRAGLTEAGYSGRHCLRWANAARSGILPAMALTDILRRWLPRPKPGAGEDRRHATGLWGEELAARLLAGQGCRILGRRVRVGRRDELDLIVRDRDTLVFVEVRTRAGEDFGRPVDTIHRAKRAALSRAAIRYMTHLRSKPDFFRFDVVEVIGEQGGEAPVVRRIENAFSLDARYKVPW